MEYKKISVDMTCDKSIIKSSKLKTKLENIGFNCIATIQTGLNTFDLTFIKK